MSRPNELLSQLYGTIPGQTKVASAPTLPAGNDPVSKEAAARFAEDDFRGRVIAHAYTQERAKIAAHAAGQWAKVAAGEIPPEAEGADQIPPELMQQLQAAGITPEQFMQMVAEEQAAAGAGDPGAPPAPAEGGENEEKEAAAQYAALVDYEAQKQAAIVLDSQGINPFTLAPYKNEQEKVAAAQQFQAILAQEQAQNDVQEKTAAYVNTVLARLQGK